MSLILVQVQSYTNPDESVNYMVLPFSTIGDLREEIAEAEEMELAKVKLYFNGELLSDNDQTVTDAGFVYGVLVRNTLRPTAPTPVPELPAGEIIDGNNNG